MLSKSSRETQQTGTLHRDLKALSHAYNLPVTWVFELTIFQPAVIVNLTKHNHVIK